jgi:hypothetical protein
MDLSHRLAQNNETDKNHLHEEKRSRIVFLANLEYDE